MLRNVAAAVAVNQKRRRSIALTLYNNPRYLTTGISSSVRSSIYIIPANTFHSISKVSTRNNSVNIENKSTISFNTSCWNHLNQNHKNCNSPLNNGTIMRLSTRTSTSSSASLLLRGPFLLLTTACVLSFQGHYTTPICHADDAPWLSRFFTTRKDSESGTPNQQQKRTVSSTDTSYETSSTTSTGTTATNKNLSPNCPFYGCLMRPIDVHYHQDKNVRNAMDQLRLDKRVNLIAGDAERLLSDQLIATSDAVTLTLIGYKGGSMREQINQDRSIIVAPYKIFNGENQENKNIKNPTTDAFVHSTDRILLGVFDGHANLGEVVSEYASTTLPVLLAQKLVEKARSSNVSHEIELTKEALEETFVELDKSAPAEISGGCTATVVLQQGSYIYVANAGDSRSFIVTYRPSTNTSVIIGISREDKPNLPDERARVELMGGQVYIPIRGTSRVVYHDPQSGAPTGLAMSRSIGDWEAGKLGVIPNPLIQVYNIQDIVTSTLQNTTYHLTSPLGKTVEVQATGEILTSTNLGTLAAAADPIVDDVYIFAVCATDGMMDYLTATEIGHVLGHSLYAEDGAHPVAAAEHLIYAAASYWQQAKLGRYRDDIAIAVSTLRRPPLASNNATASNSSSSVNSNETNPASAPA